MTNETDTNLEKPSERWIVLDTETTGLYVADGNRIIEVGCVEVIDGKVTGNNLHFYVDPERETEDGALDVHGWDRESLKIAAVIETENKEGRKNQKIGKFSDRYKELLNFIEDSPLVIHNAPFDMEFLDMEFERAGLGEKYLSNIVKVFDTLPYSNNIHPGKRNNLDALCKRYKVDNSSRDLHGALLDAKLLADVFLKLKTPENDQKLSKSAPESKKLSSLIPIKKTPISQALSDRQMVVKASSDETKAHKSMFDKQLSGASPW